MDNLNSDIPLNDTEDGIEVGEVPKGGHFAAAEQPALFVAELRKAFGSIR